MTSVIRASFAERGLVAVPSLTRSLSPLLRRHLLSSDDISSPQTTSPLLRRHLLFVTTSPLRDDISSS
jgi:hypothetical protein